MKKRRSSSRKSGNESRRGVVKEWGKRNNKKVTVGAVGVREGEKS